MAGRWARPAPSHLLGKEGALLSNWLPPPSAWGFEDDEERRRMPQQICPASSLFFLFGGRKCVP
eukprot:352752-Pyramimonas_sp.AAC.1